LLEFEFETPFPKVIKKALEPDDKTAPESVEIVDEVKAGKFKRRIVVKDGDTGRLKNTFNDILRCLLAIVCTLCNQEE